MKTFYFILIIFLLTVSRIFAQSDSTDLFGKRFFISGSFEINRYSSESTSQNPTNKQTLAYNTYSLSVGKYKNNHANIFTFGFNDESSTSTYQSFDPNPGFGYQVGFTHEYYKMFSKRVGLFLGGGIRVTTNNISEIKEQNDGVNNIKTANNRRNTEVNLGANAGLIYFPSSKWAFTLKVCDLNFFRFYHYGNSISTDIDNKGYFIVQNYRGSNSYSFSPNFYFFANTIGIRYHFK
jgi:hypothetical protein